MWIIYVIIVFLVGGWLAGFITPDVHPGDYNPDIEEHLRREKYREGRQ